MNWLLLVSALIAIGTSAMLGSFFIKGHFNFLIKKNLETAERFGSQTKPIYGGILFYATFIVGCLIYYFLPFYNPAEEQNSFITLLIVVSISFFMGLADDLLSTPPLFKFVIQFVCTFVLIKSGIVIHISPIEWVNYIITVLWVVGIMNSLNMLDNMDAITSSICLSIIIPCLLMHLITNNVNIDTYIMTITAGALLGFLIYNWSPAKMYMGDNGSQYIGIFLAYIGIKYFWNGIQITDEVNYAFNAKQFIMVALAFIVPLTDTTTVTINRLLKKKSPFIGGRDHTTHFLFYRGLSTRKVAITLIIINTIGVALAQVIMYCVNIEYWLVYTFAAYAVIVFALLYINTKITKPNK